MCCSKLIKTFDFFSVCVRGYTQEPVWVLCTCELPRARACAKGYAFGLLRCVICFFQPCHTNYSPYLLTFSFCFLPLIGICEPLSRLFSLTNWWCVIGLSCDDTGSFSRKKRLWYKCCQLFASTKNYVLVIRDAAIAILPVRVGGKILYVQIETKWKMLQIGFFPPRPLLHWDIWLVKGSWHEWIWEHLRTTG